MATRTPNDAASGGADYYVTENERCIADEDEQRSSEQANESVVTENEGRPRTARSRDATSPLSEPPNRAENEDDVTNDLENSEIASNEGADITVPGISEKEESEENCSPREGKYNLRPYPNPNFSDEYRN